MNIGIVGIGKFVPKERKYINELKLGKNISIVSVPCADKFSAVELATYASESVIREAQIMKNDIDMIINCQASLHDHLLWQVSAGVAEKLNIPYVDFCDIYQGCSGFLTSINIAKSYLNSFEKDCILVCSSEKWDIACKERVAGKLVFGEVGMACIIKRNVERNIILAYSSVNNATFHDIAYMPINEKKLKYEFINLDKAKNDLIPINIEYFNKLTLETLKKSKLRLEDLKAIVFPHVAFGLFEKVMKRLNFRLENTNYDFISSYGDCGSCDSILGYYNLVTSKKVKKGDKVLLLSQGNGFSWVSLILQV